MEHPLENYRSIAEPNFIGRKENSFYTEYALSLSNGLYVEIDKENSRLLVSGHDMYTNDSFSDNIAFSSYFIDEYNKLEKEVRSRIDEIILFHLDEMKQETFVKGIIAELEVLRIAITKLSVEPKHDAYKSILLDKVTSFSSLLQDIFQFKKQETKSPTPKIQWLEATNLLTTLFYDLLNGQKKSKKGSINTKPFIRAKNADIEKLIIDNFLDSDGKPFSSSTIKTYLNNSRPETRVAEGGRIEIEF